MSVPPASLIPENEPTQGAPPTRNHVALVTTCLALHVAVLAYAVLRLVQAWLYPEPDPALVSWVTRIGLFWRMGLSLFIAALLAPLGARWATRDLAAALRSACWLAPLAAVVLGLQSLFFP